MEVCESATKVHCTVLTHFCTVERDDDHGILLHRCVALYYMLRICEPAAARDTQSVLCFNVCMHLLFDVLVNSTYTH
jgi:hypothetical protein